MLDDGRPDHRSCAEEKPEGDSDDWIEDDTEPTEKWRDDAIHDWNEDDQSERVDILEQIVRDTMSRHLSCLRCQIRVELVV